MTAVRCASEARSEQSGTAMSECPSATTVQFLPSSSTVAQKTVPMFGCFVKTDAA